MSRIAASFLAFILLFPAPAAAQVDESTSLAAVFGMADRQDWVLRVALDDGSIVEGRVREAAEATVRLEGGHVDYAAVSSIDRGHRVGGGGRVGAAVGALVGGVAFALLLFTVPGDGADDAIIVAVPALGAGLGAIAGGLIGATIDPSATEWQPIWPASTSQ